LAILEVKKVTKYFGHALVLDELDLEVFDSEILGLIGPNGSGKTTLFNVISGFFPPTSGNIVFAGKDITGLRADQVAQKGIVRSFQQGSLFLQSTVFDNIFTAFHMHYKRPAWEAVLHTPAAHKEEEMIRQKSMELLEFVGLTQHMNKLAGELSSGYQKALAIGIALAPNPKLLLLDEPVTTLSQSKVEIVMEILLRARSLGTTVVIIEHNMKAIMDYCNRIAVLAYGKKLAVGLPQEIRENKEVIEAYLGTMQ
jgi:branched-chain amino acid transport system ATP-binding protein